MELKAAHWAVKHVLRSLQRNGILLDDWYEKRNKPYDEKKHSDALYDHYLAMSMYDFENAMNGVDLVPILWREKDEKGKIKRYRVPSREELETARKEHSRRMEMARNINTSKGIFDWHEDAKLAKQIHEEEIRQNQNIGKT